jgi:hypothetical protein
MVLANLQPAHPTEGVMARTRLLKPGFFLSEELGRLSFAHRLTFAGLWTIADRSGRLEDRPARVKAELFPYDTEPPCPHCHGRGIDIEAVLGDLHEGRFVTRYVAATGPAIAIRAFTRHQHPHPREAQSSIEPPPRNAPENEKSIPRPRPGHDEPGGVQIRCTDTDTVSDPVLGHGKAMPGSVPAAAAPPDVNARSRHPVFKGRRFVVFDWMLEDLIGLLGAHADGFDLHAWFYQLDNETASFVLPADRDQRWAWLKKALVDEAQRRGLPIASTASGNAVTDDAVWTAIVREGPGR